MNDAPEVSGQVDVAETKSNTFSEHVAGYLTRLRRGDVGMLPILLGLIVIAIIFQSLNENFLSPRNFVNLIVQMAGITVIAIGVVYVLLLGEIDLSIGYVSAVTAVFMTLRLREPDSWPWLLAILAGLALAALIGLTQGFFITRFQLPSFVVTLAGLLVWNGVVLLMIGSSGTVVIQDSVIISIANYFLPPLWGWIVGGAVVLFFTLGLLNEVRIRRARNMPTVPMGIIALQIALLALVTFAAVYIANQDRGVPLVGLIMLVLLVIFTFIANRTRFGRYVYAIGGNKEAARRAGISVERIRMIVFMLSSVMAGAGGIILASRLRSVDTASGGGSLLLNSIAAAVIGGTSLFGGSGRVVSAFLGALVIATIENGMGLLNVSAGVKFVVTGSVLLIAVLVDAITRRARQS
ncbi:MAG: sugar ABC transporter permease [Chloroflexota bacterium]